MRRLVPVVLVLALGACGGDGPTAASTSTTTSTTTSSTAPPRTEEATYDTSGPYAVTEEVEGECWTRSIVLHGRDDAWRCMSSTSSILDPCLGTAGPMVCAPDPWTRELTHLRLTGPLPTDEPVFDPVHGNPWAIELATGARCTFAQGAGQVTEDGKRHNWGCDDGTTVIGDLDTSAPMFRAEVLGQGWVDVRRTWR